MLCFGVNSEAGMMTNAGRRHIEKMVIALLHSYLGRCFNYCSGGPHEATESLGCLKHVVLGHLIGSLALSPCYVVIFRVLDIVNDINCIFSAGDLWIWKVMQLIIFVYSAVSITTL
ncbi:hypothetical protein CI102_4108 [Trichoderma harzianum]|nr:hypothetical protein CI102_4108 [Trichoderma harzianum]